MKPRPPRDAGNTLPGTTAFGIRTLVRLTGAAHMTLSHLLSPATLASRGLRNHVVMSPMTRSRAIGNVPNELMAEYYAQRAAVGLIVTEGTSPSPDGLGYPRIPGAYSDAQRAGWKLVADAVHARGGSIFVQLMHTGRVAHEHNLPAGARVVSAS